MRIELPIQPDKQKYLYMFEGEELIAEKPPGKPWKIKTVFCNKCGECCRRFYMDYDFPPIKNGVCKWLEKTGECELGRHMPFKCKVSTPHNTFCCVRFKEIK